MNTNGNYTERPRITLTAGEFQEFEAEKERLAGLLLAQTSHDGLNGDDEDALSPADRSSIQEKLTGMEKLAITLRLTDEELKAWNEKKGKFRKFNSR